MIEKLNSAEGCDVEGEIDYSVLFSDVTVEEGASCSLSIIMPGGVIKRVPRLNMQWCRKRRY